MVRNQTTERLEAITTGTLIVGVDIAKTVHWARFVDYLRKEIAKAMSFQSNRQCFEDIVTKIKEIINAKMFKQRFEHVMIGIEPTGHYWKTAANYLSKGGL